MPRFRPAPLPTVPGFEPAPAWRERLRRLGLMRYVLWAGLVAVALAVALGVYVTVLLRITPSIDDLKLVQAQQPSVLLSADGQQIASFRRAQQERLTLDKVSPFVVKALVATEDKRFYDHRGIDFVRSFGAVLHSAAGDMQGGSTITQQLAKNLFLSGERTLLRKGQELVLTLLLEALLSKERILEIYLNSVEWGEGIFGAEAAAQHYYRKPAARLSAYEAARLAVMLPRPKYFETRPASGYLASRAGTIVARMGGVELP